MQHEMVMPKMGESITEGTILKWLKKAGDTVEKDELILEISTDKVDSEIPSPVNGVIHSLLFNEGDTVEVGKPIALIETDSKDASVTSGKSKESNNGNSGPAIQAPEEKPVTSKSKPAAYKSNRFYSPVVMNIANENNISFQELESIPGSGINGRVTKKDILNYLQESGTVREKPASTSRVQGISKMPSYSPGSGVEIIEMDHVRKSIAKHMIESKHTSAHVSLYSEVDMSNVSKVRERNQNAFKNREGFSLTYTPFIADSTVQAIKEFPILNASIDDDNIVIKHFINLGIAVAVDYGLIVPNIFKADERNLVGLARAINDLAARARTKKLKPEEVTDGTFSISNFGVYGTTIGFPIINQPQVAILGVGAIKKRTVVINDAIAIRPICYLSLIIDHRLVDGAMGAQFLQRITQLLEDFDPDTVL